MTARTTEVSRGDQTRQVLERMTLENAWAEFRKYAIPLTAPDAQVDAMRQAFVSGAFTFLTYAMAAINLPSVESARLLSRALQELETEIKRQATGMAGDAAND